MSAPASAQTASGIVASRQARDIDAFLTVEANAQRLSGVVLVARGDEIVLERGYGMADYELGTPMRADAILRIGSLTKSVTASAIMVAMREGRIRLDDRVCASLPRCPTSWAPVTLRHLLTHTSGIRDHNNEMADVPLLQAGAEIERLLGVIDANEPLQFQPGERFAYGNWNYVLLGYVLERVYGQPWERVLREKVLNPAGVSGDMDYDDVWSIVPRRAHGYSRTQTGAIRNAEYRDHGAYSAGGLRTTARDLFRWSHHALSGRLLGPELTREALTPGVGGYAYGWNIRNFFGRRVAHHNGGMFGFASHLQYFPDDDVTIIVISNIDADAAILRACDVGAIFFGVRPAPSEAGAWAAMQPNERCGIAG